MTRRQVTPDDLRAWADEYSYPAFMVLQQDLRSAADAWDRDKAERRDISNEVKQLRAKLAEKSAAAKLDSAERDALLKVVEEFEALVKDYHAEWRHRP